jgi:transcriptional regulator with XRE-family HTH domain
MEKIRSFADPVRDTLLFAENAPAEFAAWPAHECLRRLRIRFRMNRKQLAAKAGVSASLVGRAEKGADIRLSTLQRLYVALGCRLLTLPSGGVYELDWRQAHLDNEWIDWKRKSAVSGQSGMSQNANVRAEGEII